MYTVDMNLNDRHDIYNLDPPDGLAPLLSPVAVVLARLFALFAFIWSIERKSESSFLFALISST